MLYIIHGDDEVSSRKQLLVLKSKYVNFPSRELAFTDTTPQGLLNACVSFDVFDGAPLILFDISKAGRASLDDYLNVCSSLPEESVLIVFSNKLLTKTNPFIKNALKLKAQVFTSQAYKNTNIFSFVDAVFYGNRKQAYLELKKLLIEKEDPFYIFTMLLYGLRNLALGSYNAPGYSKMSPFVKSKVNKQLAGFSSADIKDLYSYFYELDKRAKTGQVSSDLLIPLSIEKVLGYKNK
ncbi:MAG: DNA polymerase III subunit delta [Patescibacteria group bacterium]